MPSQVLSVTLPDWEGPLDLLLHVIRTHKLEVLDIPIAFVTEQYLIYLDTMRSVNLDIAGEYLEMAATLVHIKSRMMLPTPPDEEDEEILEEHDPREDLIRRLREYQRYQDAAAALAGQPLLGHDTFVTGSRPTGADDGEDGPLLELGLFDLAEAFRRILERTKPGRSHDVSLERITISERIGEISAALMAGALTRFDRLFPKDPCRFDVVITLLALLEMAKLRMARLFQASTGGPLYVTLGSPRPASAGLARARRTVGSNRRDKTLGEGALGERAHRWKNRGTRSRTAHLLRSLRHQPSQHRCTPPGGSRPRPSSLRLRSRRSSLSRRRRSR